jgi:HK97 gp10 family phage protein
MTRPRDVMRKRMATMKDRMFFIAVNSALYECADAVRAEAYRSISAGSVSGNGHEPSAPGEAPNRDSGTLQDHLETTQPEELMARVTSSADHAEAMEFGTSTVEARPYLRPARDKVRPRALKILNKRVRDATRRRNTP